MGTGWVTFLTSKRKFGLRRFGQNFSLSAFPTMPGWLKCPCFFLKAGEPAMDIYNLPDASRAGMAVIVGH
jgi:hypothetical protein